MHRRSRAITAALGALMAALTLAPAGAYARAESLVLPAEELIFVSPEEAACLGENVTIEGSVHAVFRDGELAQANLRGVYGIGETTGDRYRIVGTTKGDSSVLTFNITGGSVGHRVREHVVVTPSGIVQDSRSFVCF